MDATSTKLNSSKVKYFQHRGTFTQKKNECGMMMRSF